MNRILLVIISIFVLLCGILIWQLWPAMIGIKEEMGDINTLEVTTNKVRWTENFPGMVIVTDDFNTLYDEPMSESLRLVSEDGRNRTVRTCREYLCANSEGFQALDRGERNREIVHFEFPCLTFQFFQKSGDSKESYLSEFNLKDHFLELPLTEIFGLDQMGMLTNDIEDVLNSKITEMSDTIIRGENLDITHERGYPFSFEILLMGWGDFDGDGIEDVLLYTDITDSFWGYSNLAPVIISRLSNDTPITIIKRWSTDILSDPFPGLCRDEFAGWTIHRDEEYGYEIKYPEGWIIDERWSSMREELTVSVIPELKEGAKEWPGLFLYSQYDPLPGSEINYEAIRFSVEEVPWIGHMVIKVPLGEKEIFARCALYLHDFYGFSKEEVVDLCNKILSTFRFL